MGILIVVFIALIAFLILGPVTVFKTLGWVLVVIIGIVLVCLPFISYRISREEVEQARISVRLRKANLKDATEEEREYAVIRARHEAKYVTTSSIRRFFGKDF